MPCRRQSRKKNGTATDRLTFGRVKSRHILIIYLHELSSRPFYLFLYPNDVDQMGLSAVEARLPHGGEGTRTGNHFPLRSWTASARNQKGNVKYAQAITIMRTERCFGPQSICRGTRLLGSIARGPVVRVCRVAFRRAPNPRNEQKLLPTLADKRRTLYVYLRQQE